MMVGESREMQLMSSFRTGPYGAAPPVSLKSTQPRQQACQPGD